jgi:hypothetical protein
VGVEEEREKHPDLGFSYYKSLTKPRRDPMATF